MCEIKEKFEELAYECSVAGVMAFIADTTGLDDGVHDAERIVNDVDVSDYDEACISCDPVFEECKEEYGHEALMEALQEFMSEHSYVFAENAAPAPKATSNPAVASVPNQQNVSTVAVAPAAPTTAPVASTTAAPVTTAPIVSANPAPVQNSTPAKSVPYACFISDGFESQFDDWDDFRQCISDMEKTEQVFTHDDDLQAAGIGFDPVQPNLKISSIENNPIGVGAIAKAMNANVDAVLSSMLDSDGTGLAMEMDNGRIVPIGWSAIAGMEDRAGLTPNGFKRHWKKAPELAAIAFNGQFKDGEGGVTVIERCHKVRGMMSSSFAYAKFSNILDAFNAFWMQQYPKATVQNMYISHTEIYWELNLQQYKQQIFIGFPDLLNGNAYPVLLFASSNTANSAFRIMPAMGTTGSNVVAPLCQRESALSVYHTASGNFEERCNTVMESIVKCHAQAVTMLDSTCRDLQAMHTITVNNAYNAILRVMADANMPKKQGMEAAENFKNVFGNSPATAFDCFMCVVNAYSFFVRDNKGKQSKHFEVAMAVGKAAGARWEALGNIAGDFSW